MRRLPDFLFIGADKAGSTWLFKVLRSHPSCFVPACKDIYFFDRYYARGLEWYTSFFASASSSALVVGELSHDYLYSVRAADRIARILPSVKILVSLRNPVERTFSEYLYLVRNGLVRGKSLRQALAAHPDAIDHSQYTKYLPSYLERFPQEQIGIFYYDQLENDSVIFAKQVFAFLGIDFVDGIDYEDRVLAAAQPRSATLARCVKAGATVTRHAGFPTLVSRVKRSRLPRLLYTTYAPTARPQLTDTDRRWLHAQLDRDTAELENLLGRSFRHWMLDG